MFCGTILVKARAIRVFDFQGTILAVNTQNTWAMFMCVLPTFPNRLFARAVIVLHERPIFTRNNPVRSTPPDIADRYGLYHRVLLGRETICPLVRGLSSDGGGRSRVGGGNVRDSACRSDPSTRLLPVILAL